MIVAMEPLKLHSYQDQAVDFIHDHEDGAGLFLEMGLGKTCTSLTALEPRHFPVLVVAPKRVAEKVWPAEQRKWRPDLTLALAAGSPAKRAAAIREMADITVISRDNLKDVPSGIYKTVILDELSSFKNRGSQRWKMAKKFCQTASYVWGLTGTPTPNGLLDLWPQMYLLDQGETLGKTLTAYRTRFFKPKPALKSGVIPGWDILPGSEEKIHALLEKRCLSMQAIDHLDLQPVTFNEVRIDMPAKVKRIYVDMKDELVSRLDDGEIRSAANAAAMTNRLSQIAAGFLYPDVDDVKFVAAQGNLPPELRTDPKNLPNVETQFLHDEKIQALKEILEDNAGTPVLVFYRYQEEKERILRAVPEARLLDDVDQGDWDDGKVPVMLAHPDSAGHGLNLQHGGHTIVWTSLTWSMETYQQANARLARQGQKHPVMIHAIMMDGSIDDVIKTRVQDRESVQQRLMDHLK